MNRCATAAVACGMVTMLIGATVPVRANQVQEKVQRFEQAETMYGAPPVPARSDRVWKAIPGLNGWSLDKEASEAVSARASDGKTHLVWKAIPPNPSLRQLPIEPVYRGPDQEKTVSLMVNVSWGEQYLPEMLRVLADKKVHATFFLDGAWVKKNPGLAKDIARHGHAIGSHGTGHPDFQRLSIGQLQAQMTRSNEAIRQATGKEPIAFAPPSGAFDGRTVAMAHRYGLYTILWTVDTIDWKKPPADTILRRVLPRVHPGSLVLMHPTAPTAQALPSLIDGLRAKGYQFRTIDDVVHERRVPPPEVLP